MSPSFVVRPLGSNVACYRGGTLPPAWGDYDNDGYLDLPLYRNNRDGTFSEIPGFRSLLGGANFHGAAWGDYDNDGNLDLAILAYGTGRSVLLHNGGDGTFTNVAPALGLDVAGHGETAIWGDYNGDGWLDLFAPYYADVTPFQSFLYLNNGDGTFTETSAAAGVSLADLPMSLRPEGAQWADWNGDGRLDFYAGSHLFENLGNGRFEDVREQVGLPRVFDEGAMFVDYDNDGDLDFYLRTATGGRLFRNDCGTFTEVTAQAGIPPSALKWGDNWADVNHDGWIDFLYVRPNQPALLLMNQGDGTFAESAAFTALNVITGSSAFGDYDNDGDLDMVIDNRCHTLLNSQLDAATAFPGSYLRVKVVDAAGRQNQHGATIHLRRTDPPSAAIQTRVVDGGSGYLTQNQYAAHFGVAAGAAYALDVSFPTLAAPPLVADGATNPILQGIVPGSLHDKEITVYRDGWVMLDHHGYPPSPPPNLLLDPGMEEDADGDRIPDSWRGTPLQHDARRVGDGPSAAAFSGRSAFQFRGSPGAATRVLTQSVTNLAGAPGDRLDVSAWARGQIESGAIARIRVLLRKAGAQTERFTLNFPAGTYPYTRFVKSFTTAKAYDTAALRIQYRASAGRLLVDDVSLARR